MLAIQHATEVVGVDLARQTELRGDGPDPSSLRLAVAGVVVLGGGGDFTDVEIARAVAFMANNGGGKFEEPKAPAAEGEKK